MLILCAGNRLSLMRSCVAQTMAVLSQALTHPRASELDSPHLLTSLPAERLANLFVSRPSKPSIEQTKGVK